MAAVFKATLCELKFSIQEKAYHDRSTGHNRIKIDHPTLKFITTFNTHDSSCFVHGKARRGLFAATVAGRYLQLHLVQFVWKRPRFRGVRAAPETFATSPELCRFYCRHLLHEEAAVLVKLCLELYGCAAGVDLFISKFMDAVTLGM